MSEELKISGKIVNIFDAEEGTSKAGKAWKKQGFLIDTGASYNPEVYMYTFGIEKCDKLNENNVGDHVAVSFNVESKEWNGKYFTNLNAWKFDRNNVSTNEIGKQEEADVPF